MKSGAENRFTVRLGRIHAPSGSKKFVKLAGQVRRAARQFGRASGRSVTGNTARNAASYFQRRVIVKVSIVKMGGKGAARQAAHIQYIGRDGAGKDNEKSALYDRSGTLEKSDDFIARTKNDPHQFRIIVSPEDSLKMKDLELFTSDMMRDVENTLGTGLDWVAANHYDTATPHVHIIVSGCSDNGKRLLMPRDYIKYGLRDQAERLVTLELGPMHVREAGQKLARQVTQERLTGLDRGLLKAANDLVVDVGTVPKQGEYWTRRLDIERLKYLSRMGLVKQISGSNWQLSPDMESTLRALGERGDILKAYHKALGAQNERPQDLASVIYNPDNDGTKPVTGRIIARGVLNDISDQAYCVLDTTTGRSLFVNMGNSLNIEELKTGDIVVIAPKQFTPKPSDITIDKIAIQNGGIYSLAAHMKHDPSARPDFMKAHIRRLEAMRRLRLVTRHKDGSWRVPDSYLEKVAELEIRRSKSAPVNAKALVRGDLQILAGTLGRTWLDEQLMERQSSILDKGFGGEVSTALIKRRAFLVSRKILETKDQKVTRDHLAELEKQDVYTAGKSLESKMGKPFTPAPARGRLSGKLVDSVERTSGRYAILERSKDFTLVPWRHMLENRRGMEISGQIKNGQINWQLGRKRGLDIS